MNTPIDHARFQDKAPHYLSGRPAYSPQLIRRVAQSCGLDGSQRLMDLGCGPGQLALAFSTWIARGLAVDPEPEMLQTASELGAGLAPNIDYRLGASGDLDASFGTFSLVVIGRAFHWMDRDDTLARLDRIIGEKGAIALFATSSAEGPRSPWFGEYKALLADYGRDDKARAQRKSDSWESHEDALARSAFNAIERITVIDTRRVSKASLLARPLSMSSLSRSRLGARLDELLDRIETLLAPHADANDMLFERIESTAMIARRAPA